MWLEDANDRNVKNPFSHNSANLVKIHLPNLELENTRSRYLETFDHTTAEWTRYRIERHSIDGRSLLRRVTKDPDSGDDIEDPEAVWVDLAEEVYRWVV